MARSRPQATIAAAVVLVLAAAVVASSGGAARAGVPIKHVIVLYQENHSFDDVFGRFCHDVASGAIARSGASIGCDGAIEGKTASGKTIPLAAAPDYVPYISHTVKAQQAAIDGGAMDGFSTIHGCGAKFNYQCYQAFSPSSIPSLTSLAEGFALSDHTFELRSSPSWGGHLEIAASTLDGFSGNNPKNSTYTAKRGPGWGCRFAGSA